MRYIDADALLENLKKQYGEELGWQCTVNMSDVGMMIDNAPTADVVPKSEVEKIFAELERLTKETMRADEKCMDDNSILEWRLCCLKDFLYWLAKLKKKYTEDKE